MRKPFVEKQVFEMLLAARNTTGPLLKGLKERNRVYDPVSVLREHNYSSPYASNILSRLEAKGLVMKVSRGRGSGRGGHIEYVEILSEEFPEVLTQPKPSRPIHLQPTNHAMSGKGFSAQKTVQEAVPTAGEKVITLIDYQNLRRGLTSTGRDFPYELLKELGRKYGIALTPRVFISHAVSIEAAMKLGLMGYLIMICPPKKIGGPDTVDERIHSECAFFAEHPAIGTFIIVSNDRDFRETEDLLKNNRKRVVVASLDVNQGVLKTDDGDVFELPTVGVNGEIVTEQNGFGELIVRMKERSTAHHERDRVSFIRMIISECEHMLAVGDMEPPRAKSFEQLKNLIWNLIHTRVRGRFTSSDCHKALDALVNNSDVILAKVQTVTPRRFYVYNPHHSLPL